MNTHRIITGDCYQVLPTLAPGSVDLIVTDPPYNVIKKVDWDIAIDLEALWEKLLRVAKKNAAIIFTANLQLMQRLITSQPKLFRYELIWKKTRKGLFGNANRMPLREHEYVLIFYRQLPTYNPQWTYSYPYSRTGGGTRISVHYRNLIKKTIIHSDGRRYPSSVLSFSSPDKPKHPTAKPVKLMKWLIDTYSNEGELVLDPFAGSGTTAVAAALSNRNSLQIELLPKYMKIAAQRIEQEAGLLVNKLIVDKIS